MLLQIQKEHCINCAKCLPYCPVGAIITDADSDVSIDHGECVECSVCKRSGVCPVDAFARDELAWPRVLRYVFSDPRAVHTGTGIAGRGTEEMKTNEITNRYRVGMVGIGVELGRPGIGTRLKEAEKLTRRLAEIGVHFEPDNPLTELMTDENTGAIREDVKDEKVLSAIVEFLTDHDRLPLALRAIEEAAEEVDTVFSVALIDRLTDDVETPNLRKAVEMGFAAGPSLKMNVGLGKTDPSS